MSYERIKGYFEAGLWNVLMVKKAVKKGIITTTQFTEITGEEYGQTIGSNATAEALAILRGEVTE
jgi:hypothetical protein